MQPHTSLSLVLLSCNSLVKCGNKKSSPCINTDLSVATSLQLLNWCFLHSDCDGIRRIGGASLASRCADKEMTYQRVCSPVFQITGALQPWNVSVYHIQSNRAEVYAGTVASQVLIRLDQPAPLAEVMSSLKDIVKRVYEVIDTEVQG